MTDWLLVLAGVCVQCSVVDELMQPAVHALVLVAQSQAGMWRRNGFSLQHQVIVIMELLSQEC